MDFHGLGKPRRLNMPANWRNLPRHDRPSPVKFLLPELAFDHRTWPLPESRFAPRTLTNRYGPARLNAGRRQSAGDELPLTATVVPSDVVGSVAMLESAQEDAP
jgi:hypothetical protein